MNHYWNMGDQLNTKKKKMKERLMKEEVEDEEPLSPMARVYQSPGIDTCIITKIGFKNKIIPNLILDDLKHNVSKHPRFSSILSDNGTRWIKTKVTVEDHVFVPDIDLEEIKEDGDSFLDDYVYRLTMIPLERLRPLWDIHILNVKTSDAEAVGVMRCHHSLGDGMSLMSLLLASTRKSSDAEAFPTIPAIKRREIVSYSWFFTVCNVIRLIWNTIVDLLLLSATVLFLKDTETPIKEVSVGENNPKRFHHRSVSLDDIRLIKNAMDMTINDVLLGVTQAALSRYINRKYGNTNAESGKLISDQNNLPNKIRLRTSVAVNLRQEIGIQPMADMLDKGSKCRWGNYNSIVFFPFSICLETDPLVHLSKAKSTMDRKKHSLHATLLYSITDFILNTFGAKIGTLLANRPLLNTTTSISNIVGPVEEVSLHGNQITYIALSLYGLPRALVIHYISYAEKMIISIAVDPTVIPDPQNLFQEMEESLKAMKDALSLKGLI